MIIHRKYIRNKIASSTCFKRNRFGAISLGYLAFILFFLASCEDFVEADLPQNQLAGEAVFEDSATVTAALRSIYGKMRETGLLQGSGGLNLEMGLYADELNNSVFGTSAFFDHSLQATNPIVAGWWDNAYNLIFASNAVIEGVENSTALSLEEVNLFRGEALFVRAYLHLMLTELFGDIPYINTTDFQENNIVTRTPKSLIYESIVEDLTLAISLLPVEDTSGERVRPYRAVAQALLARTYLYSEQWEAAETVANLVINQFTGLESDLNAVFLKNSIETIWQFKPRSDGFNTGEGNIFIIPSAPSSKSTIGNSLLVAFEPGDQRRSAWIGSVTDGTDTLYFPFKYKERLPTDTSVEFSILFRLSELYLIRAEARAQQGDIAGAQADINIIRNRAGLGNTIAITTNALLEAILQERQVELFTEFGHRWFDLKRMGKAAEVLAPIKPGWRDTDVLLPIPEEEILVNPNLAPQNPGY